MEYEVVSKVAVSDENGRIVIEVERSDENPPFRFTLSTESAKNLAWALNQRVREVNRNA